MEHDELVDKAKKSINQVFSDTTVGREATRDSLKDLREHIDIMLDALR